jgi:glycyl-tRNA synthetase beta chain
MPEFFLELFSEEIPARMQLSAAIELTKICQETLADLSVEIESYFYGPRRIALAAQVAQEKPGGIFEARGPRDSAPEAALAGFLGKHKASREDVVVDGGYFFIKRNEKAIAAADLVASLLPTALAKFSWPKSMRWGQSGNFTWVRPLRRIICLLDGKVVPITLGPVTASNETEGHRFLAPGTFTVSSALDWKEKLRKRFVIVDQDERQSMISEEINAKVNTKNMKIVPDEILINEVNGLVEWPVPLMGKIDESFMDLPPEVRELSMKVNQRYFAIRDRDGNAAPCFAFVANIPGKDGPEAIISGNERVLRARLSDARHFWDLDLRTPLRDLLPKLDKITFHERIGSQGDRSKRIGKLAQEIVNLLIHQYNHYDADDAKWAGILCKADLLTGMVGEFPELQGVIGGYYAAKNGWPKQVSQAITSHYQPRGPNDQVPTGIVPCAVALADKLDTLIEFFKIGEKPTGSSDPYALRRAALGIGRIILENKLDISLKDIAPDDEVFSFIIERLRTRLLAEGKRHDILLAVFETANTTNLLHLMLQVEALTLFLDLDAGAKLLAAYRRAANILKVEDAKDGPHAGAPVAGLYEEPAERGFSDALVLLTERAIAAIEITNYGQAMNDLSFLSAYVDDFFLRVTINADPPELRRNRLKLLAKFRDTMHQIADFSKIEG